MKVVQGDKKRDLLSTNYRRVITPVRMTNKLFGYMIYNDYE
jgi:hypothetical protein